MSVVFSILFGALGAVVGGFLPRYLQDDPAGWKWSVALRGGLVGAAWGMLAGIHLGSAITSRDLIRGMSLAAFPALILALLAAFGVIARSRARRSRAEAAPEAPRGASTIAAVLGVLLMVCFFFGAAVAENGLKPATGMGPTLPTDAEQAEMGFRMFVTAFGGIAGAFLLFMIRREFASVLVGIAAGQFAGATLLFWITGPRLLSPAVHSGLAAAAGGLCTAFEWALVGMSAGAALGTLFAVVWLLIPGISAMADVLGKDEYEDEMSVNRGVKFGRAIGGFGKLADDFGPLPVIGICALAFAGIGCFFGFLFGPVHGEVVLKTLQALV